MSNGLGKVLFTEDEIAGRIGEVADEIDRDYIGKELIVVKHPQRFDLLPHGPHKTTQDPIEN